MVHLQPFGDVTLPWTVFVLVHHLPQSSAQLEAAQEQAKAAKKGKWSSDPGSHHIRNLIWDPPEDIASLSGLLAVPGVAISSFEQQWFFLAASGGAIQLW